MIFIMKKVMIIGEQKINKTISVLNQGMHRA